MSDRVSLAMTTQHDQQAAQRSSMIILCGHARLPQNLGTPFGTSVTSVEVAIDPATSEIVDASFFPTLALTGKLIHSILVGRRLSDGPDGPDGPTEAIQQRLICASQRALITAVLNIYEAFGRWRSGEEGTQPPEPASPAS